MAAHLIVCLSVCNSVCINVTHILQFGRSQLEEAKTRDNRRKTRSRVADNV